MLSHDQRTDRTITTLRRSWQAEKEGAATYRYLASQTRDAKRRELLDQLAEAEERHARTWEERLRALGIDVPTKPVIEVPLGLRLRVRLSPESALQTLEAHEKEHVQAYQTAASESDVEDAASAAAMREVAHEEGEHARTLRAMVGPVAAQGPRGRLESILRGERHVSSGSWIGDAIYGANDGLGAIFGLVSGVAGAAASSHFILLAGVAGAVAAAVSMGSGAYLAAKSEREVFDAELAREREEAEQNPEEEREELSLFYQLRGFGKEESEALAERLSQRPKEFLRVLAQEELGLSEERLPNPAVSALSATISTGIGASLPVIPYLFFAGTTAVLVAFIVSLIGHFAVGAAKSLFTIRSWWSSGLEMTLIGVLVGVVTYTVGYLFGVA